MDRPLILLADDDLDTLEAYEALLRPRGYTTANALDGTAALAKAIELRPDLIILDVGLPRMDGLEVLYRLRAHADCARIPVVVVSGHAFPDDITRARRLGCDAVLVKPCDPLELCRMAELLVQRAAMLALPESEGAGRKRPSGPRRASRRQADAPAAPGRRVKDLESLLLWSDFLDRQAAGLRLDARALCDRAREVQARSRDIMSARRKRPCPSR
jgi:CheY-like chemotaxis protein